MILKPGRLGLDDLRALHNGGLQIGLDPAATPLLARRTAAAQSLDELLFAFIVLADDRAVSDCILA